MSLSRRCGRSVLVLLLLFVGVSATSAERPWLVVNEDNDHFFYFDASWMNEDGLNEYVDKIAQGHVTHLFMCVNGQRTSYDSKTWEPIWTDLDASHPRKPVSPGSARDVWAVNAKALRDAGTDPYEVWTRRCRKNGISPWISMRMNDVHFMDLTNSFRTTSFCRKRRDLWRVPDGETWNDRALDFSKPEVRVYAFRQFAEIAERWDADGVELDWMRFGRHLRPNRERQDAPCLTEFMRRARERLRELSLRRGRPVRLAVRLPRSPAACRALGYDIDAWLEEDLIDVVVAHSFYRADFDLPVKEWIDYLRHRDSDVVFLPGIDQVVCPVGAGEDRMMTMENYRALAHRFYQDGAKGVYLFNAPYGNGDYGRKGVHEFGGAFAEICCEGLSPASVAAGAKEILVTRPDFPSAADPVHVPPLLKTFGGRAVTQVGEWEAVRRPEIRERFLSEVYGRRPEGADRPRVLRFERIAADCEMPDGKSVRKRMRCVYGGPYSESSFPFTAFVPKADKPAPAFLLICNRDPAENLDPDRKVKSEFWPVERIVDRGYAAIAFWNGDVALDEDWGFDNGVFRVFQRPCERTGESWGVLSAWAWGASRVMDWVATEPSIDAAHVGVVGHSRGGKSALLAGVCDERFAMTCANCSGCGGTKLNHMENPMAEHIDQILDEFGFWFCGNFGKYRCREAEMDIDQHQWAALVAPRLLAIASASADDWAGQRGEFATGRLASPAWELYGRKGLVGSEDYLDAVKPMQDGCISYHLRTGEHDLTAYDWDRYMDFADRNGWRGSANSSAAGRAPLIVNESAEHFFAFQTDKAILQTEGKPNIFVENRYPFPKGVDLTERGVERYVDALAGGKLTHLFVNVNYQRSFCPSRAIEPVWTSLDEPDCQRQPVFRDMKEAFARGLDVYAVMMRRCRQKGVSPWLSFRMNDIHGCERPSDPMISSFWKAHPEWQLKKPDGMPGGLDYAQESVRDRMSAYICEMLDRYDADGVELDFIRFPYYFRPGTERANAPILTAFLRKVREICEESARRRGHPVEIAVRLLPDPKRAEKMGADVGVWAREGLVDMVVVCNMYWTIEYDYHLCDWRRLLGDGVRLVAGSDNGIEDGDRRRILNLDEYRHWMEVMRGDGAEGFYFFNFPLRPYCDETWRVILGKGS